MKRPSGLTRAIPTAVCSKAFRNRSSLSRSASSARSLSVILVVAMGVPLIGAVAALRLTVGPDNSDDEVDYLLSVLPEVVAQSRARSGGGASAK